MSTTAPSPRPKATGGLFAVAALLLLGANLAHPVDAEPSALSRLDLAGDASWVLIHLVGGVGMLLLATAMVMLARSVRGRGADTWASVLEVVAIVGGGSMAVVFTALDGFGAHSLANAWSTASGEELVALEGAAVALEAIDSGMAGLGTLLLLGAAFGVVGVLVLRTGIAPAWQGGAAVVVGALGTLTGVMFLLVGATPTTINVLLRPTALGATLTAVALGVGLTRSREQPTARPVAPAGAR